MDIMNVGYGFYMMNFDHEGDITKAVLEGPWMIYDHYLSVRSWSLDFIASRWTKL
ncbi:hypothetical protein Lalb_Chr18g0050661 [Lupinus albus]|uniref:DUF4283 domain-containing protein n=1 Tax=Lupinus albus TaxID=3870 RepID=A0A6A4NXQ9_LUPAL|nr:hypothetical protein Lalb_Chr18g0050661 [Lupinus albus]